MNAPRKGAARSAFYRGSEGMRKTDEEIEHAKQRAEQRKAQGNQPFRFYVPVGETRRIIICDEAPDFFMYEHALKDADGRWGRLFCGCIKEFDNCPVCSVAERESYYAMVLTCIDLTPFTLKDGTEVEFSRKLLIVKPAQQKKFLRFYSKEGTLRGAMFDMTRDGDKDSAIGNDIDFVEFVEEDEMQSYTRTWKDKDGKRQNENCDEPYDYEKLFEEPTAEKLRALVGGGPTPGSREAERSVGGRGTRRSTPERGRSDSRKSRGDDDWEDADDSSTYGGDDREKSTRRGRAAPPARGRREAAEEVEPPRRSRRPAQEPEAAEEPTRGRRTRTAEPEPEPERTSRRTRGRQEEAEDEGDEDKMARRPTRGATREAPATGRTARRAARKDDDFEDDDIPF